MIKIAYWGNGSASEQWRLHDPARYMNQSGLFDVRKMQGGITESAAQWADMYILQGTVDKEGIALLAAYQGEKGKKIIVEQDDQIEVEDSNPHKQHHDLSNASEIIKITMGIADMVTTTTPYLAKKLEQYNKNVRILPNYMDMQRWDIQPKLENTSDQIRIGWAGSITHLEDLQMIMPVLHKIYKDFPKVIFVFVGDMRIKEYMQGIPVEVSLGVPFEVWPTKLNSLRLDIALAPLRDSEFNRSKSNIKSLEYAIAKYPAVYSKTVYEETIKNPDMGLIAETEEQWYSCIKNLIISKNLREDIKMCAYNQVKSTYNLEKKINLWIKIYSELSI